MKRSNIENKIFFIILGIFLFLNLSSVSTASDEIAPGTVINAGNIEQYKDYFPYFMQRFITDGWDMAEPVVIKTKQRETTLPAKAFMAATESIASDYPDGYPHPIHADEPFEMRDVHAIEIKAKNPRYPESKRDIWITGDIYYAPYAQTYDKTGKLWKGIFNGSGIMPTVTGESGYTMTTTNYIDFKTEYWSSTIAARLEIDAGLSPEGYDPTNFHHADFEFLIN